MPNFGEYLTTILEFDALVLNEDRHFNNIAILSNGENQFKYCPIFDNGAAFLSDISISYPIGENLHTLENKVKSKPFSTSFEKQVEVAQSLYGKQLTFSTIPEINIKRVLKYYNKDVYNRISEIYDSVLKKTNSLVVSKIESPIWCVDFDKTFTKTEKISERDQIFNFIAEDPEKLILLTGEENTIDGIIAFENLLNSMNEKDFNIILNEINDGNIDVIDLFYNTEKFDLGR